MDDARDHEAPPTAPRYAAPRPLPPLPPMVGPRTFAVLWLVLLAALIAILAVGAIPVPQKVVRGTAYVVPGGAQPHCLVLLTPAAARTAAGRDGVDLRAAGVRAFASRLVRPELHSTLTEQLAERFQISPTALARGGTHAASAAVVGRLRGVLATHARPGTPLAVDVLVRVGPAGEFVPFLGPWLWE